MAVATSLRPQRQRRVLSKSLNEDDLQMPSQPMDLFLCPPSHSCIPHAHLLVCIGLPPNPPAKPKHAAAAATGGEKHGNEVLGSPASCAAEHAGFSPPLKTLHSPGNGPLKQSVFVSKGSAKNVCTLMPPTNCKERKQWRTSQAASAMPMEMLAILYHALCVI